MESVQTNQSEEMAEREIELAERFNTKPEEVQLLRQIVEDVFAEREYESELGDLAQEQLLSKRFGVPVEKVRQLGGLAAALLKRMLKDQADTTGGDAETKQGIRGSDWRKIMGKYKCKRCHNVIIAKLPNCPECSSCDGYDVVAKAIEHNHNMDGVYHPHCPRCKLNEVAPELLEVLIRTKAYLASLPGKYAAESRYLQESVKDAINKTKAARA